LNAPASAAGIESPRGRAEGTSQAGQTTEVPLYDLHKHVESNISPGRAEAEERTGAVRLVRSRGQIMRAYRLAPAHGVSREFYDWHARTSGGGPTVMQARRIVRAGR